MLPQMIVNGLLIGGVYGLAGLGLSLIWGVMGVVNIAHGAFIMLGAYASYWMFVLFGLHPFLSATAAVVVGMATGLALYRLLIEQILVSVASELEQELMTLLLTFALSILIYGSALILWGADLRGIPLTLPTLVLGELQIPLSRLSTFASAIILGGALYLFLKKTYLGKAIRAVAQSRNTAMLSGINPVRIFAIAFGIGIAYAMVSGVMISLIVPVTPFLWDQYLLKSFTVVVLGGLGNPLGAFVGGVILGLAESLTILFASYAWSPTIAFALLILILIVKPTGLLGAMRQVGPLRRI
jgi:branched-subunit amino acid ABC-type transport system permease component